MECQVKLGHVALPAADPGSLASWYRNFLGLAPTLNGTLPRLGDFTFLSGRPEEVLQELTFMTEPEARHVAFEVDSLASLRALYSRAREQGVRVLATLDHQSSVSVMLVDPEGNSVEIYWPTGLKVDRLEASPIDLDRPEAELMQRFQTRVEDEARPRGPR